MISSHLESYRWILDIQIISEEGILVPKVVSWVINEVKPNYICSLTLVHLFSKETKSMLAKTTFPALGFPTHHPFLLLSLDLSTCLQL